MKRLLLAVLFLTATLAGCTGGTDDTTDVPLSVAQDVVPRVDAAALLGDLKAFATSYPERADNLAAHLGAREFLARQYEAAGLEVWRQGFVNGIPQENILGIKWGEVRDEWVVVGGHYDMVTKDCVVGTVTRNVPGAPPCAARALSQGAYDDGSGTLMTVHLAKAFANVTTHATIVFANFDGEERGLQGSGAFAETVIDEQASPYGNVTVRAMLDLDMFGLNWPGVDAPILFDENSDALRATVEALAADMDAPEGAVEYHGINLGRSDYARFEDRGIPTGFFISDFEEWQFPADLTYTVDPSTEGQALGAYPFWHIQDTYQTMEAMAGSAEDLEAGFQAASDLAAGVLWRMASEAPLEVRDA